MELEVLKLGGSMLEGQEAFQRIAGLIQTKLDQGILPVCVVSAMKGVTDNIIAAISAILTEAEFNPVTFVEALYEEHLPASPASASLKELQVEFEKLEDARTPVNVWLKDFRQLRVL